MINGSGKSGSLIVFGKPPIRAMRGAVDAMESIESMKRVFFNQVFRKVKNFVMHRNDQIRWPFTFKQMKDSVALHWNKIAFTPPAREGCEDFRVRHLGCNNKCILSGHPLYLLRPRFPDVTFDQSGGNRIDQRQSSRTVAEMGDPDILTREILPKGFFRGSMIFHSLANSVSLVSDDVVERFTSVGKTTAIRFPRSVITASSPFLVCRRYSVSPFLGSLTPTTFMLSPYFTYQKESCQGFKSGPCLYLIQNPLL